MQDDHSAENKITTKRSRRIFRGLLLITLIVILVPLIIIGYRYGSQLNLIQRLETEGCRITTVPVGPNWLRNLLGEARMRGFDVVRSVSIRSENTSLSLQEVSKFKDLQKLVVVDSQDTKEGLNYLRDLKQLEILRFSYSTISDQEMRIIAQLKQLRTFGVEQSQIDDDSLKQLESLPNLTTLILNRSSVTDEGLKQLSGLTSLKVVHLVNTNTTAAGYHSLRWNNPQVEILNYNWNIDE